jgi:glycosyltransferase involved in cell wall biosynthesis
MLSRDTAPFVSVIVPVYNGRDLVAKNIESLLVQDYPKDRYEIIIIDNGSTDDTREIIRKYPVVLLEEKEIHTSYAARNRGINFSKGEVIAFTDADCIASQNWISSGVRVMRQDNIDMVGGAIEFIFPNGESASDLLDSLINLNNEVVIKFRHSAQTANLFAKKDIFNEIGLFPAKIASGGDALWTYGAWKAGHSLKYDPKTIVLHPSRGLRELLKKHLRVGTGSIEVWRGRGQSRLWIVARFISLFLPVLAVRLPWLIKQRGKPGIYYPIFKMIVISYLCTIASAYGIIKSLVYKK